MPDHSPDNLSRAILSTLAYSNIFEYPLTASEIHRYLTGVKASLEEIILTLDVEDLWTRNGNYFTLRGRADIIDIRKQRESHSRMLMPWALRYGRILGFLPFIRMVALTGSLAVMNSSGDADFDYMLVTAPGRVWTARAFALLFNRFTRLLGHTLCPNLIVSENVLEWQTHDLYSARELRQMIPISGMDVYHKLMKANEWIKEFLPNATTRTAEVFKTPEVWKLIELTLHGKLGDQFENWEMNRKIRRFQQQVGFGEETLFNANICQGNFDQHRKRTKEMLESKLLALEKEVAVTRFAKALSSKPTV